MKRNKLAGWKDVFSFTVTQTLKSKTFLVSFIIMALIAIATAPVMSMITSQKEENDSFTIEKVYVYDETSVLELNDTKALLKEAGWDVELAVSDVAQGTEAYQTFAKKVEAEEPNAVLMFITAAEGPVSIFLEYSGSGEVSSTEIDAFETVLVKAYEEDRFDKLNISEEQRDFLAAEVYTELLHADTAGNIEVEEDTSISDFEYWFLYALLFVGTMICMMTGSQVANAIVVEKSSKVVEYLLTSVRPLAIIVGKVLAMLCVVLTEVIGMIVLLAVSNKITGQSTGQDMIANLVSPEVLSMLNPLNVILGLLFLACGMIFYATLAGLAGATVSRIEEAGEGLVVFTLSTLIGMYVSIAAAGSLLGAGDNAFALFAMLFPLSSPFLMPGAILIGKASPLVIAGALALIVILIVVLFWFVARVYEALIVYNGNRIKLTQLFKMRS